VITKDSLRTWCGAAEPMPKRGRPVAPASTPVTSRLRTVDYDKLASAALRRGMTVSAFVRAAGLRSLREPTRY